MSRIRRGWQLTKKSWAVLREHRSLIRFPVYGGVATIAMTIVVVGPGLYLIDEGEIAPGAPLVVVGLYLLALIGFFFNVGLAACADRIFRGEQATVADGMAVARGRFPQIAGWAALAASVGLILSVIQEEGGIFGAIVGRLIDVGWTLITFLAVPVIAIEGTGPGTTLKRSASLFKERWGQQITGNLAIGGALFLLGVLPGAALIVGGVVLWATSAIGGGGLVFAGVAIVAVALLVSRALTGIFGVALYHYALEGEALGGFTTADLESAVRHKRGAAKPATI